MRRRTLAVALTGGIGSGKSEVGAVFRDSGALVISADREARSILTKDPVVRRRITALLGRESYTPRGGVNRAFIAERIFGRPALRRRVNGIIHPAVIRSVRDRITKEKKAGRKALVVVEAALIFEAGMEKLFDTVIVVDAPVETRIARIRRRDGLSRREALGRIRAQDPVSKNRSRADIVIANRGDRKTLRSTARFVCRLLTGLARPA